MILTSSSCFSDSVRSILRTKLPTQIAEKLRNTCKLLFIFFGDRILILPLVSYLIYVYFLVTPFSFLIWTQASCLILQFFQLFHLRSYVFSCGSTRNFFYMYIFHASAVRISASGYPDSLDCDSET